MLLADNNDRLLRYEVLVDAKDDITLDFKGWRINSVGSSAAVTFDIYPMLNFSAGEIASDNSILNVELDDSDDIINTTLPKLDSVKLVFDSTYTGSLIFYLSGNSISTELITDVRIDGVVAAIDGLTDDLADKANVDSDVNSQSGDYTLLLTDAYNDVEMTGSSSNTITIPLQADVVWTGQTKIRVLQSGTGTTSIEGDTGVTVNVLQGYSLDSAGQYAIIILERRDEDVWLVYGNLALDV